MASASTPPSSSSDPPIDFNNFETVVLNFISLDPSNREAAKGIFNRLKTTDYQWLRLKLIDLSEVTSCDRVREAARFLIDDISDPKRGGPSNCKTISHELDVNDNNGRYLNGESGHRVKGKEEYVEDLLEGDVEIERDLEGAPDSIPATEKVDEDWLEGEVDDWLEDEVDEDWYHKKDIYTEGIIDVPKPVITHVEAYGYPDELTIRFFFCLKCSALFVHYEQLQNHEHEEHEDFYFCRMRYADIPCHMRFIDPISRDMHEEFHVFY